MSFSREELTFLILSIVAEIPEGYVATYGQIALLANCPKHARLVGVILHQADLYGQYPCHRVVNHNGRLAPHFFEQKKLLEMEGIHFRDSQHVDLKMYQWKKGIL